MITQAVLKKMDKGFYKGYRIEKQWAVKAGKILDYTVIYIAYDKEGNIVESREKLKALKKYLEIREG